MPLGAGEAELFDARMGHARNVAWTAASTPPCAPGRSPESARGYTLRFDVTEEVWHLTDGRDRRERWALVLGASSGFGGATAKALGRDGYAIVGVHLDLRASRADAEAVRDEIAAMGVPVVFHNVNAADAGTSSGGHR